jgi:nitrogen regulation protein NR(I)
MPSLLVVDDETAILHAFRRAFTSYDLTLITAQTGTDGLQRVQDDKPDVVVLDINLPDRNGLDVFREIQSGDARIPVIFITGHGTTDTAIEAIKLGAFDYLLKPLELDQVEEVVERALEISRRMRTPAITSEEPFQEEADLIVGRSPQMQEIYKAIGRVAAQDVTVLLLGETGTGKDLIARAIYQHSRRAAGPFLAVNCAAIPDALLESELFGHEKGAFTGADRRRIGKFEQCSGGTLFLDEIGDMTPLTQAKVLRVLQDQTFERVGGSELLKTDVRVIAATNRDLAELAQQGEFRSDLYYRLSVFTITLPPLRDRGDDIVLLVRHFLRKFGHELGKDVRDIDSEALAILTSYRWPGNVRELQSVIKQALLHATGAVLLPAFLPASVFDDSRRAPAREGTDLDRLIEDGIQAADERLYAGILETVRRKLITRALEETGGNQLRAAKLLGITRGTLRSELRALGISVTRHVGSPESEES